MTSPLTTKWSFVSRVNIVQTTLAVLALLCAVTVIESRPDSGPVFYGRDFDTITGLNSTTEVFAHGGRYLLHDYSALVPGCNDCDKVEFQIDTGMQIENRAPDAFNRYATTAITPEVVPATSALAVFPLLQILSGQTIQPTSPPPR